MRFIRNNSLTIVLLLLFAGSIVGQWIAGWHVALEDALHHDQPGMTLLGYTGSPEFLSTAVLVILSIYLRQRESPESKTVAAPHRQTGA